MSYRFIQPVSFGFIGVVDSSVVISDLERLGYRNSGFDNNILDRYVCTNVNEVMDSFCNLHSEYSLKKGRVEAKSYDEFLALAAMTDKKDGIEGEWWVKIRSSTENFKEGKLYKQCSDSIFNIRPFLDDINFRNGLCDNLKHFRKATLEEIREHFNTDSNKVYVEGIKELVDALKKVTDNNSIPTEGDKKLTLPKDWDKAVEYFTVFKLPKINGYEGKDEGEYLQYGCAKLPIEWFKDYNLNREITEITLSSGVKINLKEIEQIKKYLK